MRNPNCTICGLAALRPVKLFSDDELVCRGCYNKQIKQNAALVELCREMVKQLEHNTASQKDFNEFHSGSYTNRLKQIIGEV